MNSELQPPFSAFLGDDPFLFVSYAHADKGLVYPIIEDLNKKGVRIWYDEGIPASSNWIDEIAETIIKCDCFLVFITPRALESENVLDEIYSAKKHKKKMFVIYLEDTELPSGVDHQIGRKQALFKHKMTEDAFWKKLMDQLEDVSSSSTLEEYKHLKIFLSYSHEDIEFADSFIKRFKAVGMDINTNMGSFSAGERWEVRLKKMIEDSDIFVLFWSTASRISNYVESEWRYALTVQKQKGGHFLRPLYWEEPIPRIPEELMEFHFHKFEVK